MRWSPDDLDRIGSATELQITSTRPDGTLRPYVTIWGVRAGDDLYIRSAYGPENGWFRRRHVAARPGVGLAKGSPQNSGTGGARQLLLQVIARSGRRQPGCA